MIDVIGKAELVEDGLTHAESVKASLQNVHIDTIYSSPLKRCQDTIRPLSEAKGITPVIDDNLKEFQILSAQDQAYENMDNKVFSYSQREEGDETPELLFDRTEKFLKKIVAENP